MRWRSPPLFLPARPRLVARVYGTNHYKIRHLRHCFDGDSISSAQQHARDCFMRLRHSHMSPVCRKHLTLRSPSPPEEEKLSPSPPRAPPSTPAEPPRSPRGAPEHAPNTPTRPSPCAPRLPRDALGSLSTPHMRGSRTGGSRGSYGGVPGVYVKTPP